jgi:phage terminase large subunit-like protein
MTNSSASLASYERDLLALKVLEAERSLRLSRNRLIAYRPYNRQAEFHAAGAIFRERLLMAGNQVGKTISGSMEAAMHATGIYPPWWVGRRFDKPTVGWAAGVTGETTRDNVQRLLFGRPNELGTGSIPFDCILGKPSSSRGVADLYDTAEIKHITGATSIIALKSYATGRDKWQGETLDWVWFDEEPDEEIYTEGLTRTNATGGLTWMTFTPLLGMSKVVKRFLMEKSPDRSVTTMRIEEAEHYTPEQRAQIIAAYPPHEREARAYGRPVMGSGLIFPITEESIRETAIVVPEIWARIAGLDIGWDHPTACVWLAHDRDNDVVHVTDCYRLREQTPVVHAAAIKARGPWIPVAWPHDALQHDKASGEQIAGQYRLQGVAMLSERATFDDGTSGVEAGLMEMLDRMKTGRLKIAEHLNEWWEEFRLYHRKDGVVVKETDDLMSATRYGLMMLRHAAVKPQQRRPVRAASEGAWMS